MTDFDGKVKDASARLNRSVHNIAETLEKETAELVTYLHSDVVPAVRGHSSKALRVAAQKLSAFAEYLDAQQKKDAEQPKDAQPGKDAPPGKES